MGAMFLDLPVGTEMDKLSIFASLKGNSSSKIVFLQHVVCFLGTQFGHVSNPTYPESWDDMPNWKPESHVLFKLPVSFFQ